MINIQTVVSKFMHGAFEQNTYVLYNKKEAVIIDAGAEVEDLKSIIQNRKVLAVLITHLHFDHIWNLPEILKEFDCSVYIQKDCENSFIDSRYNASYMIRQNLIFEIPSEKIEYFTENLKLGKFEFKVYQTPGHSRDCVCFLIDKNLFTGDTIFKDSIGRTDLMDSDNKKILESLKIIKDIDFKTAYHGHYESSSKEEVLDTINMFL